tara:strand:- start:69 stop:542 length:474 start_codon:yes stop_codon:yes gene_type:complete
MFTEEQYKRMLREQEQARLQGKTPFRTGLMNIRQKVLPYGFLGRDYNEPSGFGQIPGRVDMNPNPTGQSMIPVPSALPGPFASATKSRSPTASGTGVNSLVKAQREKEKMDAFLAQDNALFLLALAQGMQGGKPPTPYGTSVGRSVPFVSLPSMFRR